MFTRVRIVFCIGDMWHVFVAQESISQWERGLRDVFDSVARDPDLTGISVQLLSTYWNCPHGSRIYACPGILHTAASHKEKANEIKRKKEAYTRRCNKSRVCVIG